MLKRVIGNNVGLFVCFFLCWSMAMATQWYYHDKDVLPLAIIGVFSLCCLVLLGWFIEKKKREMEEIRKEIDMMWDTEE